MSANLMAALERKDGKQRDTNRDVGIASIWGVLYLLMVGGIFVTQYEAWLIVIVLGAISGGGAMLIWRGRKQPDHDRICVDDVAAVTYRSDSCAPLIGERFIRP